MKTVIWPKRVISWIAYAYRPLTLRELQHGLSLEPGDSEFDEDAVTIPDILTSVCAGLVIIDKSTGTTRFYHYSAQEYFRTSQGRGPFQSKRFPDLQKDMAVACLTYLSLDEFAVEGDLSKAARKARVGEYPFLEYAVRYWSLHAGHVPEGEIRDVAMRFLGHEAKVRNASKIISHTARGGYEWVDGMIRVDETQQIVNATGETGLMHAVRLGWLASTRELIEAGGDIHAMDYHGQSVLYLACEAGKVAVFRVLRECGLDIRTRMSGGRTVLHAAAASGNDELVELLLEDGAEIDAGDVSSGGETPLFAAAYRGHASVTRLLLKAGANPNAQAYYVNARSLTTTNKRTALFSAAMRGHEEVVQALIDGGG
jgi:hypothetical protein